MILEILNKDYVSIQKSNIEDKPFRFIFHPLIMVALSILLTLIFI